MRLSKNLLVSASSIGSFLQCPRKYAWRKIAHVADRETIATRLGGQVHGQLENYVRDKAPLDFSTPAGSVAAALLPHVDDLLAENAFALDYSGASIAPGDALPEIGFILKSPRGVGFVGFIDLYLTALGVADYKTTSAIHYAKTPVQLRTDPQALIYSKVWQTTEKKLANWIYWLYTSTRTKNTTQRVELQFDAQMLVQPMAHLELIGREIAEIHALAEGLDEQQKRDFVRGLTPNMNACNRYGGCAYQAHCSFGFAELAQHAQKPMKFLDTLESRIAERGELPTPQPQNWQVAKITREEYQDMPQDFDITSLFASPVSNSAPRVAINPPESASPAVTAEETQALDALTPEPVKKKARSSKKPVETTDEPLAPAVKAVTEEFKAATEYPEIVVRPDQIAEEPTGMRTIYLDCVPTGWDCDYVEGAEILTRLNSRVFELVERLSPGHVGSYRTAPYKIGIDCIAEAASEHVATKEHFTFVLSSDIPEDMAIFRGARGRANLIVRGTR